jgi:predicted outer membrane protein
MVVVLSTVGVAWGQNAAPQPTTPLRPRVERAVEKGAELPGEARREGRREAQAIRREGAEGEFATPTHQAGMMGTADQQIAAVAHACAHNEVALSKFVLPNLKSEAVKKFAQQMIEEHSHGAERLAQIAGPLVATNNAGSPEARNNPPANPPVNATREVAGTNPAGAEAARPNAPRNDNARNDANRNLAGQQPGMQQPVNWVKIHEQIADQTGAAFKQEMGKFKGENLDRAYIGQQLGAHIAMVNELKVLRNYASPELQQQLDTALKLAESHLQEAQQIMDTQTRQDSSSSGRTPSTATRDVNRRNE